ncbi:MAG: hypothetical protein WCT27_01440 [Patescibacteria group bacterium]
MIFSILFLIFCFVAFCIAIFWFVLLLIYKAPYVKTPTSAIETILNSISIRPEELVYDLGCGDADVLIALEKKFGCRTIGYEASPFPYIRALRNIRLNKAKTQVYWRDFFKADLSKADIVFCFLIQSLMPRVGVYLQGQLKPGSRVICYGYPIPNWPASPNRTRGEQPTQTIDVPNTSSKIYCYQR